jgi:hypothetical protein
MDDDETNISAPDSGFVSGGFIAACRVDESARTRAWRPGGRRAWIDGS